MGFLLTVLVIALIINIICWLTHLSMTPNNETYGWGNYRQFVREFNKIEWRVCDVFRNLEGYTYSNSHIFASKIKFDGIYMKIKDPISYALCIFYSMRYKNRLNKKNNPVHKWD